MDDLIKKIEALLFVSAKPVEVKTLSKILKVKEETVSEALEGLAAGLKNRGVRVIFNDQSVQMVTAPENSKEVALLLNEEFKEELTSAALETLAIVAYRGPIVKSEIDFIRGVNSTYTLRNLLIRGLVEREINPKDARTYLYRISFDFLRHLGLERVEDLPDYEALSKIEIYGKLEGANLSGEIMEEETD